MTEITSETIYRQLQEIEKQLSALAKLSAETLAVAKATVHDLCENRTRIDALKKKHSQLSP